MANVFRHIMVPLDFTGKNEAALSVAIELAKKHDSQVTLMHVIETIDYAEDEDIATFYETLQEKAADSLAPIIERFVRAGVPVQERVMLGKRGHGIVSHAMQNDVDLVVMSSHKVDLEDAPRGWATLSHQVAVLCQCPVLLVK